MRWAERAVNRDFSKPSGDTHKIPEKTNCRRDRDFQTSDRLSKSDDTKYKDADESEKAD